jgi:hypothetical protein
MDISVGRTEWGDFEPIDTASLPVTGCDGYGQKTPTVRELIDILKAIPEEFQDLPVGRYVDEGIRGIKYDTSYPREERDDVPGSTPHVQLW